MVKKSTLIKRLLASRHSKKILEAAHKKRRTQTKHKFGDAHATPLNNLLPKNNTPEFSKPGVPALKSWSDITMGNTQRARNLHYASLPATALMFNRVPNMYYSVGGMKPSMAPYGQTGRHGFGQYFH